MSLNINKLIKNGLVSTLDKSPMALKRVINFNGETKENWIQPDECASSISQGYKVYGYVSPELDTDVLVAYVESLSELGLSVTYLKQNDNGKENHIFAISAS
tara:strand:+ start:333 stop:638 length:306 start_codon:yes stop_codon:yes gene_type:complete